MRNLVFPLTLFYCFTLAACGAYVPDIQEFYQKPSDVPIMISDIVNHVECEVKYAVQSSIISDIETVELATKLKPELHQKRSLDWLASYAAQITLTLTLEETGSINAGVSLNTPIETAVTNVDIAKKTSVSTPQSSSVGLAATFSDKATRKETLSLFVDFRTFTSDKAIAAERTARSIGQGIQCNRRPVAYIQGDLKLKEWLDDVLLRAYGDESYKYSLTSEAVVSKKDVIQHDVTFVITYNGGVTPSWKLVRVSANQGSQPFLFGQRVNTQDVIVTIGPQSKGALTLPALNTLLSTQISNSRQPNL